MEEITILTEIGQLANKSSAKNCKQDNGSYSDTHCFIPSFNGNSGNIFVQIDNLCGNHEQAGDRGHGINQTSGNTQQSGIYLFSAQSQFKAADGNNKQVQTEESADPQGHKNPPARRI